MCHPCCSVDATTEAHQEERREHLGG
jgi:hypothetical protein